jgi:hypothetical protein
MNEIKNEGVLRFDRLERLPAQNTRLRSGVYFHQKSISVASGRFVNMYAVELQHQEPCRLGIQFSWQGDTCVDLTSDACERSQGQILFSMNCNFGFLSDDDSVGPNDISYNLHIENAIVFQLPVADKTALLLDEAGKMTTQFLRAIGSLRIGGQSIEWVGSLSKSSDEPSRKAILYNSFNLTTVVVDNQLTGYQRNLSGVKFTPASANRLDLLISCDESGLSVESIRETGKTHYFEGQMILSVPREFGVSVQKSDRIDQIILDGCDLSAFLFGVTVGALIYPNRDQTLNSIETSKILRTTGPLGSVYGSTDRFCRACIVATSSSYVFVLFDARRNVEGQDGLTIDELLDNLLKEFPDFIWAVNVDGGHAAKIVLNIENTLQVFGNLHYRNWPTRPGEPFFWNGYHGRKIPAVLFAEFPSEGQALP